MLGLVLTGCSTSAIVSGGDTGSTQGQDTDTGLTVAGASSSGDTDEAATSSSSGTPGDSSTTVTETSGDVPGEAYAGPAFTIAGASVRHELALDALVFDVAVDGDAGSVAPQPVGSVDGAPVLGYVFPTSLAPSDVGFGDAEGLVALVAVSHPDFDDTPLWDEDSNGIYDDDPVTYHAHWVLLREDTSAAAGYIVPSAQDGATLPPTAPMPMYLDSPGFAVVERGGHLRIVVPLDRIHRRTDFTSDALTAYMEVEIVDDKPRINVLRVYDVFSGDLSLPLQVEQTGMVPGQPAAKDGDALDIVSADVAYVESLDTLVFSMAVTGAAGSQGLEPIGQLQGAPVLVYAMPTSLAPESVGFHDIAGTVTLAAAIHPDFDDTPLWDENMDGDFANDAAKYHAHWVVLAPDSGSPGGLSVPGAPDPDSLPPTAPMAMYLDSPGFHVFTVNDTVRVLVPAMGVKNDTEFSYDAVTARLEVDAGGETPVLRLIEAVEILSGDLSLPFTARRIDEVDEL